MKKKNTGKRGKKSTCKRRRVRISANGSYNKSDMKHNKDCERKHKQKKTRKRRGGNDDERKKEVEELMKKWKPVKGKGTLPETAANLTAKQTVELEKKEREERELEEWIRREEEERAEAEEEWRNKKYNAWVLGI